MSQRLNAWNMSSGQVEIHAVGCQHKPGSGKAKHYKQDQVEFGQTDWTSQEDFARDYWDNGILEENEAEHGPGSFDVFQCMDFKPCVTIPTVTNKETEMPAKASKPATETAKNEKKDLPGKPPNEVPAPRSSKSKALPGGLCRCGCGREVGRASTFGQGHDAKFVSQLIARIAAGELTEAAAVKETVEVSEALCGKLQKALENAAEGKEKAAAAAKAKADKVAKAAEVKAAAKAKAAKPAPADETPVGDSETGEDTEGDLDIEDTGEDDDF